MINGMLRIVGKVKIEAVTCASMSPSERIGLEQANVRLRCIARELEKKIEYVLKNTLASNSTDVIMEMAKKEINEHVTGERIIP